MKKVFSVWSVAIIAMLLASCSSQDENQKGVPLMRVKSEVLRFSSEVNEKCYVGIVEEESSISVGFTGSGTIVRVCVNEGQSVKQGQLIAEIDKTQARNMLVAAQAQMEQANDAYERLKQLHDNNSLPEMEWVEVQSKVQQAESSLGIAKKALADCSIYAPASGVIGKGIMNVGEVVLPALPVAKILVVNNVKVKVSIPEKEIADISDSTLSQVTLDALPNQLFEGGKIEKSVEANTMTHTYDIKVNVGNDKMQLLPGMVANVRLVNARDNNVLSVPVTSVRKDANGNSYVWVKKDGRAYRKVVTIGKTVGDRIVVSSGLHAGDVVVTEGYQKLSEGMEVCE